MLDYGELVGLIADALPAVIPGGPESFIAPLHKLVSAAGEGLLLEWTMTAPRTRIKHERPEGIERSPTDLQADASLATRGGLHETFTPHQLRHSFVTNLLRAGVPIHLVSVLANHSAILRAGDQSGALRC